MNKRQAKKRKRETTQSEKMSKDIGRILQTFYPGCLSPERYHSKRGWMKKTKTFYFLDPREKWYMR